MRKAFTVFCRGEEDGALERKAARNYLVIPNNKRVYLILPDGMEERQVLELCGEILEMEDSDLIVYVFVQRGGALADMLRKAFPDRWAIQPIVIGSKANKFIYAADVVLTKARFLSASHTSETEDLGQWNILRSENLHDIILNAIENVASGKKRREHT